LPADASNELENEFGILKWASRPIPEGITLQLELGAAIAAGVGLGGLAAWAAWRYTRAAPNPREETVSFEPIFDDEPPARPRPVARPAQPMPRSAAPLPPPSPRGHAERAPAMVLTQGVAMQDAQLDRRAPARSAPPRAPMREPPPMRSWAQQVKLETKPAVPTEWARRQVGPVEPGRVAGVCGGCGSRLSVSNQRPLRIACPVCGRNKLIA